VARQQHVVLFKFPEPLTEDQERIMWDFVRRWPAEIQGMTTVRIGKDVGGRSGGYDYLLLTEFEDEDAMAAYFPHPAHAAFGEWVFGEMRCEVLRVDYPLDETTQLLGP
jgi:hypothetical protein